MTFKVGLVAVLAPIMLGAAGGDLLPAAEQESNMTLLPDEVAGVVVRPDGETPIADLPVRVWSVDKQRIVYRTRTDDRGVFEIPWLRKGRSLVFVGKVKIDLEVLAPDANSVGQQHDIVVVVPHRMLVAGGPRGFEAVLALPPLISP